VATTRDGGTGGRRRGAARGRRGRPEPEASEVREAPAAPEGPGRAGDMVMVDPWGALLAGLLETAEGEAEEPTGAGPAPGRDAADTGAARVRRRRAG
jgi:hypothetical protein